MRRGQTFEDKEVVSYYRFRPEYSPDVFQKLVALSPGITCALDLGCGTGKVARGLSQQFDSVVAIDASAAMLEAGKNLQNKTSRNIEWIQGLAESVELADRSFDLVVAAASIHWMDHEILFPRLSRYLDANHVFAVVEGDGAYLPPWRDAWDEFLEKWIYRIKGESYEPGRKDSDFNRFMTRYRDWIDVKEERFFAHQVSQSIDDFIRCQYSRDTFALSRLGTQAAEFNSDLRSLLEPHAESGVLTYTVRTKVEWGTVDHPAA